MPIAFFTTPPLTASAEQSSDPPVTQSQTYDATQFTALSGTDLTALSPTTCTVAVAAFNIGYTHQGYDGYIASLQLSASAEVSADGSSVTLTWSYQLTGDNDKPTTATCTFVILATYGEDKTQPQSLLDTLSPPLVQIAEGVQYPGTDSAQVQGAATPNLVVPMLGGFDITFGVDDGELNNLQAWLSTSVGTGGQITGTGTLTMYGSDNDNGQGTVDIALMSTLSTTPLSPSAAICVAYRNVQIGVTQDSLPVTFNQGTVLQCFAALQGFFCSYEDQASETGINRYTASVSATSPDPNTVELTFGGGVFEEDQDNMPFQYLNCVVVALVDTTTNNNQGGV